MNERYRWTDEERRRREEGERRDLEQRASDGWRGEDHGRDVYRGDQAYGRERPRGYQSDFERNAEKAGRWVHDHLDTSDRQRRAESDAPNRAWRGREPYPMDVGGINRPGEDRTYGDPLDQNGGRSGRGTYSGAFGQEAGDNRGYGGGHGGQSQYGRDAGGRNDQRQRDYGREAYGARGSERYVEGGYETRGHGESFDARYDEDRSWWRKARDEFNAWLGDREAEARRRHDHEVDERYGRHGGDWRGHDDDTGWRDPISPPDSGQRAEAYRNDRQGYGRDDDRRFHRDEPRDHRPGWFRDGDRDRY